LITLAAHLDRQQTILCRHHSAKHFPILVVQLLIAIQVKRFKRCIQHLVHHRSAARGRNLGLADHVIFIFVVGGESFFKRNRRYLPAGLILREAPTVDVKIFRVVTGNRLHLAGETTHPPNSLAIVNRVG
jgi:hypothetical protein